MSMQVSPGAQPVVNYRSQKSPSKKVMNEESFLAGLAELAQNPDTDPEVRTAAQGVLDQNA